MPTTFRFLTTLVLIAAVAYGAMYALATLVQPRQGEITVRVPPEKLQPKR